MKHATIYCDGSSIGNPGPGGWGAIIDDGKRVRELGGAAWQTTNNRMELTAALEALAALTGTTQVVIHTDSQYVIRGMTQWIRGWEQSGWQTKDKKDVANADLWRALRSAVETHEVTWKHVRGHAGVARNERADRIANAFARNEALILFEGTLNAYEKMLADEPRPRVSKKNSSRSGVAYSYVSLRDGVIETHATWALCEARVKGKSRVRFKKALSAQDEAAIIRAFRDGN
jgi:ribonuclease HI